MSGLLFRSTQRLTRATPLHMWEMLPFSYCTKFETNVQNNLHSLEAGPSILLGAQETVY